MPDNTPTPIAEQAPEAKVTFDERQQAKIEAIIADVTKRTASDLRTKVADLEKQLAAAKSATPAAPDLSKDLDLTRAELASLRAEQSQAKLDAQLRAAAGDLFLDSDLAVRVMKDSVRVGADGKVTVVDANGGVAMNAQFSPMTLAELALKVADQKRYLARGRTLPGAGSTPFQGTPPSTTQMKLEDLFGRKSNGALANSLALKSPTEYRRLRALAVQKGLI